MARVAINMLAATDRGYTSPGYKERGSGGAPHICRGYDD